MTGPVNALPDAAALCRAFAGMEVIAEGPRLDRLSRDFSWFSPVLKRRLAGVRADLVVRPANRDEARAVAAICAARRVPLTLRGAGTGNYGQCMPLCGGVVMDMSRLTRILWIRDGIARIEAGVRLKTFDDAARPLGWELRLLPSTFRLATIGGFFAGGFGGIGSITYGSLKDRGNVLGLRAMSLEENPREEELRGDAALAMHHAYGVNGIITEIEVALAPALPWTELLIGFADFDVAMRFGQALGGADGITKKLLTVLAAPIPQTIGLTMLPRGHHAVIAIVATAGLAAVQDYVRDFGGEIAMVREADEAGRSGLSLGEYSWNHTTLHFLKHDPGVTYLQSGFVPGEALDQITHLRRHFGDELMMHVEFLRSEGALTCSGLPLLRYTNEARLDEIIAHHRAIGVHIANPHTPIIEEGGKNRTDPAQLALKRRFDPYGLLNPGKLRGWDEERSATP